MTSLTILAFLGLRGPQLFIIIVLALLVFGASRLPSLMRNLGKGVHSFKQGIEDAKEEMNKPIKRYNPEDAKAKEEVKEEPKAKDTDA